MSKHIQKLAQAKEIITLTLKEMDQEEVDYGYLVDELIDIENTLGRLTREFKQIGKWQERAKKVQTTLLILFILISALLWAAKPAKAMRRESDRLLRPVAIQGEIVEGRSMIVNIPGKRGYTFILEV